MPKPILNNSNFLLFLSLGILSLGSSSCFLHSNNGSTQSRTSNIIVNDQYSVDPYHGRILADNPVILTGKTNLTIDINMNSLLTANQTFITRNPFLEDYVTIKHPIDNFATHLENVKFAVKQTPEGAKTPALNGRWAFDANSQEFLEVHTFAHLRLVIEKFQRALMFGHYLGTLTDLGIYPYHSAIPKSMYYLNANWQSGGEENFKLNAYTSLDFANAYFDPATFSIHFGGDYTLKGKYLEAHHLAYDPTIIYHESGHAFVNVMMNLRNFADTSNPFTTAMGLLHYDEAGAINEGICDYFSYAINQRTHIFEWAYGTFYQFGPRPLSEDDPLHAEGISLDTDARLSYPQYINYLPQDPLTPDEDVHNSGLITSHYLVALTNDLKAMCHYNHETATNMVIGLLAETLAEMGDLSARGADTHFVNSDIDKNYINLNPTFSQDWISKGNPINYRSFFQTFGKKALTVLVEPRYCPDYHRDRIEQLLDHYGLLMFKNYNEDGNNRSPFGTSVSPLGPYTSAKVNTFVSPLNRLKSSLVAKKYLQIDERAGQPLGFVIDRGGSVKNTINEYIRAGRINPSDIYYFRDSNGTAVEPFAYNNNNGRISPGEIVGVALNLFNGSNSTMAGVQILANDWDHLKLEGSAWRACNNFADRWPLDSEGAANVASEEPVCTPANTQYPNCLPAQSANNCNQITTDNTLVMPVCMVQQISGDATVWVDQESFRQEMGLVDSECLGYPSNTSACLIRAIPGADYSIYSKIEPQKNILESKVSIHQGENSTAAVTNDTIEAENVFFLQINPNIPPGTHFNCRVRARFTNCDDCWHDPELAANGENFLDFEYSGPRPFEIINFQFSVVD